MEQWYWMGINDDKTQGFVYTPPPQDANPPVNPQTRKRRRTGTVQDKKLPKRLKPEKVKEAVVEKDYISKSSPVKRATPSQSRKIRSKTPLSPPRISSSEPIGVKHKVTLTGVDAEKYKGPISASRQVCRCYFLQRTGIDADALPSVPLPSLNIASVLMSIYGLATDDMALNELHTPDRGQILDATDHGSV
ncbi:hypothetical protein Dimus_018899 [Dionaea muscipula]